jgi:uncharacterized alkaline shock family protein YloU
MKILDRLLLFLYSLVVGIVSAVLLFISLRFLAYGAQDRYLLQIYNDPRDPWLLIALISVFALFLLISIRFLYITVRRGRSRVPSIDQKTDFGDIRISLDTVENLALKSTSRFRGVKDIKARVNVSDSGLEIVIRAVVDGESPIPQLTEDVQRSVKEHVEEITGIPVADVSVFIANIIQSNSFKSRVE